MHRHEPKVFPINHLNRFYQVAAGIFAPALIPFTVFLLAQMFEERPSVGNGSALHTSSNWQRLARDNRLTKEFMDKYGPGTNN